MAKRISLVNEIHRALHKTGFYAANDVAYTYLINAEEDPRVKNLREFLLAVHGDVQIAYALLKNVLKHGILYETEAGNPTLPRLHWDSNSGNASAPLEFAYSEKANMPTKPFVIVGDKFYAFAFRRDIELGYKAELPLLFPNLTAEGLEKCIKKAIVKK